MIKEVLLQHKKEKESLLSKVYVSREKLQMAKKSLSSELVKVVKGPRKSHDSHLGQRSYRKGGKEKTQVGSFMEMVT